MKSLSDNIATSTAIHETEESAKIRHIAVMKDLKLVKYGVALIFATQIASAVLMIVLA